MYFLDTDTLSLVHAENSRVTSRIERVDASLVATTIVTAIEILQGRYEAIIKAADGERLLLAQAHLDRSEARLSVIEIVPFDIDSIEIFDRFRTDRKLRKIGRKDLLIACICLSHKAILVTRNLRHFRQVPGLHLENWAD